MPRICIHYIYHVVGHKVGCTKNLKARMNQYERDFGKRPDYEILEELHDKTDQEAGDAEWAWADRFGYSRGSHYTTKNGFKTGAAGKVGGPIGGQRRVETTTSEQKSAWGRMRWDNFTLEQRLEWGRRNSRHSAELGTAGCQQWATCPYCDKVGRLAPMHRHHFNKCAKKPRLVRRAP